MSDTITVKSGQLYCNNNPILANTKTSNVFDDNGNSLDALLSQLKDENIYKWNSGFSTPIPTPTGGGAKSSNLYFSISNCSIYR